MEKLPYLHMLPESNKVILYLSLYLKALHKQKSKFDLKNFSLNLKSEKQRQSPLHYFIASSFPRIMSKSNCFQKIRELNFLFYFLLHSLQITQIPTYADKKFLYFNVLNADGGTNKTITIEGGGVNATIQQSDIAATNGFVHIIDRVLGVPYTTVQEKLETDPMLK